MRVERCFQKLNEMRDRISFIEQHLNKKTFLEDRLVRKAIYKEFQEIMEIVSDISAMIVKGVGYSVEDDYTNIERLCDILNFPSSELKRACGLRNVIVHEYNGVIDELAYESLVSLLPVLKDFERAVREWIKKKF
jgi:uncharacterized protein YutE (UPF0331/DUF86 family)